MRALPMGSALHHRSPARRWASVAGVAALMLVISCVGTTVEPEPGEENPPGNENPPGGNPPGGNPPATADTIFYEGFESGNFSQWPDGYNASLHFIVTDPGNARGGSRYLEARYQPGGDGGFLNTFFMPGYDSVYVRLYMRLDPDWIGGTKLVALYGSRIDNQWSAFGKAGICPNGTDFFNSMLVTEPGGGNPPPTRFYTYYPAMTGGCYGSYGDGTETYTPPLNLIPGTWHRIEFWFKINQPGQENSEQRFWIDGVERGRWSGFSVRTSDVLRINALQLTFNTCCGGAPQAQFVQVDEILVAGVRPSGN